MTKPSNSKATKGRKTAKAAPTAPPAENAASEVEELKAEIAKFDHDGDGHPGGSLPHHAAEPEVAEPVTEEEAPAPEPDPNVNDQAPETDARSQTVSLGPVECRMRQVPVEAVLGLLSPDGLRRIEAHQSTASFESTCKRLVASDGRATPVVFAAPELAGGEPTILHGFEEIAAAQVCGIPDVSVILVPAGGAAAAQSHIVEMVRQQTAKQKPSDDDELFYRVHAEG